MKKLPEHLQAVIDKKKSESEKLGLDIDWAVKALRAAEKAGDDDALIHGLVG